MQIKGMSPFTINTTAKKPAFGAGDAFKDRGKANEDGYFAEQEAKIRKALSEKPMTDFMTSTPIPAAGDKPAMKAVQLLNKIKQGEKLEDPARNARSDKPMALTVDVLQGFATEQLEAVKQAIKKLNALGLIEPQLHPTLTYTHPSLRGENKNVIMTGYKQVEGLKTTVLGSRAIFRFKED